MTPFLLSWDTEKRSISFKWDGLFSLTWEKGRMLTKILGLAIPLPSLRGKKGLSFRWVYIKEVLSFLRKWRVKKAEVAVSFSDPMANGLLYGLISALEDGKRDRKIQIDINFLGKNRFSGEAIISPGVFFQHLKRWILLLLREKKGRGQKGGE